MTKWMFVRVMLVVAGKDNSKVSGQRRPYWLFELTTCRCLRVREQKDMCSRLFFNEGFYEIMCMKKRRQAWKDSTIWPLVGCLSVRFPSLKAMTMAKAPA